MSEGMKDFLVVPLIVGALMIQALVYILVVPLAFVCILPMMVGDKLKKMWRN